MPDKLTIEVQAKQVQAALDNLANPASMRDALGALGRVLVNRVRLGFRASASPFGVPWKPLVLRKGQPLVDTRHLLTSITSQVQGNEVVIGTNLAYAPTHQFGATITAKNAKYLAIPVGGSAAGQSPVGMIFKKSVVIPARPFMPLNSAGDVELPAPWAVSALAAMAAALKL